MISYPTVSFRMSDVVYFPTKHLATAIVVPLAHVVPPVPVVLETRLFVDPIAAHVKKVSLLMTAVLLLQMLESVVVTMQYAAKQATIIMDCLHVSIILANVGIFPLKKSGLGSMVQESDDRLLSFQSVGRTKMRQMKTALRMRPVIHGYSI